MLSLAAAHPPAIHAFTLWQAFLQNVNPLSKVIYAPQIQDLIVDAIRDFEAIPAESVALLFAIYAAAITSLKDDECRSKMGEPKKALLDRYLRATQYALIAADFVQNASFILLQAFTIFLVSTLSRFIASNPPEELHFNSPIPHTEIGLLIQRR